MYESVHEKHLEKCPGPQIGKHYVNVSCVIID